MRGTTETSRQIIKRKFCALCERQFSVIPLQHQDDPVVTGYIYKSVVTKHTHTCLHAFVRSLDVTVGSPGSDFAPLLVGNVSGVKKCVCVLALCIRDLTTANGAIDMQGPLHYLSTKPKQTTKTSIHCFRFGLPSRFSSCFRFVDFG